MEQVGEGSIIHTLLMGMRPQNVNVFFTAAQEVHGTIPRSQTNAATIGPFLSWMSVWGHAIVFSIFEAPLFNHFSLFF